MQKQKLSGLKKTMIYILLASFFPVVSFDAGASDAQDLINDFALYTQYELYKNYENKQKYKNYEKYKKNKKKYGFKDSAEKAAAKDAYGKYKLYKKNPAQYRQYAQYEAQYKKYSKYKKYVTPYSKFKKYSKYKKYDKKEYDEGKNFGGAEYKAGHTRYVAARAALYAAVGEADLGCGIKDSEEKCLGPEITVGLHSYTKSQLSDSSFRIENAINASTGLAVPYTIKNASGEILATIPASTQTKVKLNSDKSFRIYDFGDSEITASGEIYFDRAEEADAEHIVFDTNVPIANYDRYRGKVKLRYCNASGGYCDAANTDATKDRIWVINTLPIEQYTWGMGELSLANVTEHNKVMVTVFRTYGYWKVKFGTKYANQGFKVTATPSSQIYRGYNYEAAKPTIVSAANSTWGKIIRYNGEIALAPYSSWTDGRTRSFQERWGSTSYPWCRSVSDPYGKHPTLSTSQLESAGNHMVGLSANGSVSLAYDHSKAWDWILGYYFYNINLFKAY